MNKLVKREFGNSMYHCTGLTKFTGCQCWRDCTCNEDFIPEKYDYYKIVRIHMKGVKTTTHTTLKDAEKRWTLVNSL